MRWLAVTAAMIGSVLEVLDTSITNVALPQMQGNLGATLSQIAWVNTGYIVSNVIVLPITGWLAARFGQRRYFAASIAVFTLASVMCGSSHSLTSLIFWRVVQGFGGGGLLSTGQVILLQSFPPAQQGLATAIFGMGVMVGPSLGPVLGGYLTDNFSWPFIFFINIPFGIAATILAWFFVPDNKASVTGKHANVDWQGFLLLAVGMGSLQTVLERGQEEDWYSSKMITWLTASAVIGLVAFVWRELTVENPIVDLRVFKNRSLVAAFVLSSVVGLGLYATVFLLPVYLQDLQGYTAFETGMTLLPSALLSMLSFMIVGGISQKADARFLLFLGIASFSAGAYGLSFLTTSSGTNDVFWPLMFRGASLGLLFIPLTIAGLSGLKESDMGTGSGMINLARQLGGSVGIAAFSTLLSRRQDFHRSVLVGHVSASMPTVQAWLQHAVSSFVSGGMSITHANAAAIGLLNSILQKQASMLAFDDAFLMIGVAFAVCVPVLFLFRKGAANGAAMQAGH